MDPRVLDLVDASMPQFNDTVTDSFHKREFDQVDKEYENKLKMIFASIASKEVYFNGLKLVKPEEMYSVIANNTQHKTFETYKESFFAVKLLMSWRDRNGVMHDLKIPYQFLPFTNEWGDLWIRGTLYSLQIVLSDRGLSVTKDDLIFLKVLSAKHKIGVENYSFTCIHTRGDSNISAPLSLNLPANRFYSPTYSRQVNPKVTPTPLLAWYVFAEYGFKRAMTEFGECEYAIGDTDMVVQEYSNEEGWEVYCSSYVRHPKLLTTYVDNNYAIAIRPKSKKRDGEIPTIALQYVAALLFLIDTLPVYFNPHSLDDSNFWKLMVGKCSVRNVPKDETIMKYMNDHFDSMANDLDEGTIKKLASEQIVVEDMFELFNYIITNRTEIVRTADKANALHKSLSSLEHTMDKLIVAANRFKHDIKNTTELSVGKIDKFITAHFRLKDIEQARSDSNLVQEATPTDCPIAHYGLGVIFQSKLNNSGGKFGKRSSGFNPYDPAEATHASVAFVFSYQRVTSPAPSGRGYLNPCIYLSGGKITAIHPDFKSLYQQTQERLTVRKPREFDKEFIKPTSK